MMKNKEQKMKNLNAGRGIERENALERGAIWVRPTMEIGAKTDFKRTRQKQETRRMIREYKENI